MLRARDRLEEAEFFLHKVQAAGPKEREFRYYFSALASAARSISWVLQKDLRSTHGARFDEWWNAKTREIPRGPVDFDVIVNLRNTLEKQGSRLPLEVYGAELSEGPVDRIEVRRELHEGKDVSRIVLVFRSGGAAPVHVEQMEGETEAQLRERARRLMVENALKIMEETLGQVTDLDFRLLGLALSEDASPIDFEELVVGFTGYLRAMRQVVEDAEKEFQPDP